MYFFLWMCSVVSGSDFKSRAQARPGLWDSNPTRRRPGPASEFPVSLVVCPAWPVRFSEYFRCFFVLCLLLEVSRRRRARQPFPRGFFGDSLALYNRHMKQSLPCPYNRLHIPLVRHGLRSALIWHISSHDKMSRIVNLFFEGKAKKIMSWFVIFMSWITIHGKKITNRDFFRSGPYPPEFWATAKGKYVLACFVFSTANQWWAHPDPASAVYSIISYHTCALAAQLLIVVGLCSYYIQHHMRCCGCSLLHRCQLLLLLQMYHSAQLLLLLLLLFLSSVFSYI